MIYNKNFVWMHFPKCAGTSVARLFASSFSNVPGLHQDPYPHSISRDPDVSWHDSISEREARNDAFTLGTKAIICPIRRLPAWLESRYLYECRRNPRLAHDPELLLEGIFLEANGAQSHADWYVQRYLPQDLILSNNEIRFLRTEYFKSDFIAIFGDYVDVSRISDKQFEKKANTNKRRFFPLKKKLPEEIREQLYSESRQVYEKCPYWEYIENLAYGEND